MTIGTSATATLAEICDAPQYGWTTRAKHDPDGSSLRLLRTTDISGGTVDWATVPFCEVAPPNPEKYLLQHGDLVLSRAGSIGFSHLVEDPPPAVFASYLIRFRPGGRVMPRYLAWFMRSPGYWRQVRTRASGIAQQNINAKKLGSILLPLPSIPAQRAIVDYLERHMSGLEGGQAALESAGSRLGRHRDALLARAFEGHPFRQLADVCVTIVDCEHRTPVYGTGNIPALRPRDVVGGSLDLANAGGVSQEEYERQTRRHVPAAGDIAYSRELSYGWAAKLPDARVCLGQGMVVLRPNDGMLTSWIVEFLNSRGGRDQAKEAATGSAHPHINLGSIKNYRVPAPELAVQEAILADISVQLSLLDRLSADLAVAGARARRLEDSLLAEAFR